MKRKGVEQEAVGGVNRPIIFVSIIPLGGPKELLSPSGQTVPRKHGVPRAQVENRPLARVLLTFLRGEKSKGPLFFSDIT